MVRLLAARHPWMELKVLGTTHLTPKGETMIHINYKKLFAEVVSSLLFQTPI